MERHANANKLPRLTTFQQHSRRQNKEKGRSLKSLLKDKRIKFAVSLKPLLLVVRSYQDLPTLVLTRTQYACVWVTLETRMPIPKQFRVACVA